MMCGGVTSVTMERQTYWMLWVFVYYCLSHPACKSDLFCVVFYCHLWPVWLWDVFCTILERRLFRKVFLEHKICVQFYLWLQSETFLILRRIRQNIIINVHVEYPLFLSALMKPEFSQQIFENQISWKSVQWERSFAMRTDIHYVASNRPSQLCQRAYNCTRIYEKKK